MPACAQKKPVSVLYSGGGIRAFVGGLAAMRAMRRYRYQPWPADDGTQSPPRRLLPTHTAKRTKSDTNHAIGVIGSVSGGSWSNAAQMAANYDPRVLMKRLDESCEDQQQTFGRFQTFDHLTCGVQRTYKRVTNPLNKHTGVQKETCHRQWSTDLSHIFRRFFPPMPAGDDSHGWGQENLDMMAQCRKPTLIISADLNRCPATFSAEQLARKAGKVVGRQMLKNAVTAITGHHFKADCFAGVCRSNNQGIQCFEAPRGKVITEAPALRREVFPLDQLTAVEEGSLIPGPHPSLLDWVSYSSSAWSQLGGGKQFHHTAYLSRFRKRYLADSGGTCNLAFHTLIGQTDLETVLTFDYGDEKTSKTGLTKTFNTCVQLHFGIKDNIDYFCAAIVKKGGKYTYKTEKCSKKSATVLFGEVKVPKKYFNPNAPDGAVVRVVYFPMQGLDSGYLAKKFPTVQGWASDQHTLQHKTLLPNYFRTCTVAKQYYEELSKFYMIAFKAAGLVERASHQKDMKMKLQTDETLKVDHRKFKRKLVF